MKLYSTLLFTICLFTGFSQTMSKTTPIKVADSLGSYHPQVEMTNDGVPAVIWTDNNTNNLYFAKHNGAGGFLPAMKLNPGTLEVQSYNWSGPDLYMEGDNIYVVFKENGYSTGHIYLIKSTDNGMTWGDTVRVDQLSSGYGNYPDVAVQNDTVWVTFMDHDAGGANPQYVVARSTDGGASFEPEVAAGSLWGAEACDCCQPEIIADDQRVIVFFRNNNSNIRDIKAVVSLDRGATYTGMYSVDDHNWNIMSCPSTGPDARFVGANKTITAYRTSDAGTITVFINEYNLTTDMSDGLVEIKHNNGSTMANYPQLDYQNGVIGIVWEDAGNGVDVYANYSSSGVNGLDPQNAFNVTDVSGAQYKPDIAVGDNVFHVVYTDVSDNDVYYTQLSAMASIQEEEAELNISVFPNPATEQLTISFVNPDNKSVTFKLVDITGRIIEQEAIIQSNQILLDVSEIPSGIFGYDLKVGDQLVNGKLIIQ